jgi:hypothetical protein
MKQYSDRQKQRIFLSLFIAVFLTSVSTWAASKPMPKSTPKPMSKPTPKSTPTRGESENVIIGDIRDISVSDDDSGESDDRELGSAQQQCQMEVQNRNGIVSNVYVTSTTIIHPMGTRLKRGMKIKLSGHPMGIDFIAEKIKVLCHQGC